MALANVFRPLVANATLYCPVMASVVTDPVTGIDRPVESIVECKAYIQPPTERPRRDDIRRNQPNNHPGQEVRGYWCEDVPKLLSNTVKAIVSGRKGLLILEETVFSAGIQMFKLQKLTGQPIRATFEVVEWQ
jgi:hypothetical protein